jgi:hypothetical protein
MTGRMSFSGVPHLSSKDDVYKDFFIPKGQIPLDFTFYFSAHHFGLRKGSMIVANAWFVGCLYLNVSI